MSLLEQDIPKKGRMDKHYKQRYNCYVQNPTYVASQYKVLKYKPTKKTGCRSNFFLDSVVVAMQTYKAIRKTTYKKITRSMVKGNIF